jgi:membrane protease YdiL (CAAX protease family)
MLERKPLTWFIIIAFVISWPLFLAPLLFPNLEPAMRQLATTGLWALGMWGPGIAALVVTLAVAKQPFSALRLNTLGPKRYYIWAWFLPPVLIILSSLLTVLIRTGQLDTEFTLMQQMMEQTGTQLPVSTGTLILIQVAQALLIGPLINVIFTMGEELGWRGFLLRDFYRLGNGRPCLSAVRSGESGMPRPSRRDTTTRTIPSSAFC